MVTFEPLGIIGLLSGLVSYALAAIVYFTRPDLARNRLLALFLVFAGSTWGLFSGVAQFLDDRQWVYAAIATALFTHVISHFFHLMFLTTLQSPVMIPVRHPVTRWLLGALAGLTAFTVLAEPTKWSADVTAVPVGRWSYVGGEYWERLDWVFVALWAFGFLVAITTALKGTWSYRQQAKAYLTAFAVHDGGFAAAFAWLLLGAPGAPSAEFVVFVSIFMWPLLNLWLGVWLSYGILRTQLFDIDLRIKASLRRGVVVFAFVGAFFLAEQVGQLVLQTRTNSLWVGLAGGAALALALVPLRRLSARVADLAMPRVTRAESYLSVRKKEIYRAALEEILLDDKVSPKERSVLDRLQRTIGLSPAVAQALELHVRSLKARPAA